VTSLLNRYKAISLDFANTLYPLRASELETTIEALHRYAQNVVGRPLEYKILRQTYLKVRDRQFAEGRATFRENDFHERVTLALSSVVDKNELSEELICRGEDAYAQAFIDAMQPPQQLKDTVAEISKAFHGNVAVCSNFIRADAIRRPLQRDGLASHLKASIVSCEIGFIKPHPAIFKATVEALGFPPGDVVHVGDDWDADVIGASRAGMSAIYTTEWRDEPDPWFGKEFFPVAQIDRLSAILDLL
jgi:HAD superfamily hydrolase (TIGR01509 family)